MKKLIAFIILLLSSQIKLYSCGYTPYGEDIRYSMFNPENFEYHDFRAFYYNSNLFGYDFESQNKYESNIYDWHNFTNKKVSIASINECINNLSETDVEPDSKNEFLQYLYKKKLYNVIEYLRMAYKCESLNTVNEAESWERKENPKFQKKNQFIENLKSHLNTEKSNYLKRKYAFLIIRVAYYNNDQKLIKQLFNEHFDKKAKDYLYYWSLFFNCFENQNASSSIANVMAYSPEKKYAAYYYFHDKFNLINALKNAKSKEEIANIYAYASVQKTKPNLDYLISIYDNSKKSRILDFLLLREINKLEDWIYTPYYTNYLPSIEFSTYWYKDGISETTNTLRKRSEKDRLYAQKVLNFVNSVDLSTIKDKSLWKAAQIQLLFMTRDYTTCISKINEFGKPKNLDKVVAQLEKIKALCLISNQKYNEATIVKDAKPIILKYKNDEKFLFSLGRELEFRGNVSDGLALIAMGNKVNEGKQNYENYYLEGTVEWQGNAKKNSGNLKYFYEYFDYLDFVYGAKELQTIIDKLNTKKEVDFEVQLYQQLLKDKNYLIDLLGTKYIRENNLLEAVRTFESLDEKYWESNYNSWERDLYADYYTFDQNPFYEIKHTPKFIVSEDKFIVTKLSVTQHLISYLKKANNTNGKDRDKYYFLVANCYLNMSQYGHSWMMRRYNSTSNFNEGNNQSYFDEIEYRNCGLAQQYYQLALLNSKTEKFKALCLRMMEFAKYNYPNEFNKLKTTYPKYYGELSNCENLANYFSARR